MMHFSTLAVAVLSFCSTTLAVDDTADAWPYDTDNQDAFACYVDPTIVPLPLAREHCCPAEKNNFEDMHANRMVVGYDCNHIPLDRLRA
jgi:hypothetical protein